MGSVFTRAELFNMHLCYGLLSSGAIYVPSSVMLMTISLLLLRETWNFTLNTTLSFLPIIGFDVDPNAMTVTMSEIKKSELVEACTAFTVRGARRTLREFQRSQGWINWSLNVFPHLRPALCESYGAVRLATTNFV
jgi:hypothetical protein